MKGEIKFANKAESIPRLARVMANISLSLLTASQPGLEITVPTHCSITRSMIVPLANGNVWKRTGFKL